MIAAVCFVATATAKDKKVKKMYLFGVATSFNDSTAYFTPIQSVDSVALAGKTGQLSDKREYSLQLKGYFQDRGDANRTCATFNSTNLKKLQKTYQALRQKYVKKYNVIVKDIDGADFQYTRVVTSE